MVLASRQGICLGHGRPLFVFEYKVVLSKFHCPAGLSLVQISFGHKPFEVLVVGPNFEPFSDQVVAPFLEHPDDCVQLTVVSWVVSFYIIE